MTSHAATLAKSASRSNPFDPDLAHSRWPTPGPTSRAAGGLLGPCSDACRDGTQYLPTAAWADSPPSRCAWPPTASAGGRSDLWRSPAGKFRREFRKAMCRSWQPPPVRQLDDSRSHAVNSSLWVAAAPPVTPHQNAVYCPVIEIGWSHLTTSTNQP